MLTLVLLVSSAMIVSEDSGCNATSPTSDPIIELIESYTNAQGIFGSMAVAFVLALIVIVGYLGILTTVPNRKLPMDYLNQLSRLVLTTCLILAGCILSLSIFAAITIMKYDLLLSVCK